MIIFLRILAQRLAIFVFAILSFFGINPDLSPRSEDVVAEQKEMQQATIQEILAPQTVPIRPNTTSPIQKTENKIIELQKEITENITTPVTQIAETIIPPSSIPQNTSEFSIPDVVVNIICQEKTRTYTRMSTGSGVIVAPSGIILTNAHVAFPFLRTKQFEDDTYTCSIRPENIPNYGYNAEVVYFPLDWLSKNKNIMEDPSPIGTGENDYALLVITSPIGPTPKKSTFSHASTNITATDLISNIEVTAAGYPGINSGVFEVDSNPGLRVAKTSIIDFFTFSGRTFDVLQTGVNSVAKRGSSGGGIFKNDTLYGLIVTTNTTSDGSYINALTIPYIKRDFENDTGINFTEFIYSPHDLLKLRFNISYKDRLKTTLLGY